MAPQLRLSLERDLSPSFGDFVVGPSNADALAAVRAWPGWREGQLALVGPEGCGKSHLAQAWARDTNALVLDRRSLDVSDAAGRPALIEDVDQGADEEALFHLINLAGRPGAGLLLTARTLPGSWSAALPDLRSRVNALPVAEISSPDDGVLEGLLRRFFRARHIRPSEEIYGYLLRRIGRSAPDAREIVQRLDEAGDSITRVLARQLLDGEETGGDLFD